MQDNQWTRNSLRSLCVGNPITKFDSVLLMNRNKYSHEMLDSRKDNNLVKMKKRKVHDIMEMPDFSFFHLF